MIGRLNLPVDCSYPGLVTGAQYIFMRQSVSAWSCELPTISPEFPSTVAYEKAATKNLRISARNVPEAEVNPGILNDR